MFKKFLARTKSKLSVKHKIPNKPVSVKKPVPVKKHSHVTSPIKKNPSPTKHEKFVVKQLPKTVKPQNNTNVVLSKKQVQLKKPNQPIVQNKNTIKKPVLEKKRKDPAEPRQKLSRQNPQQNGTAILTNEELETILINIFNKKVTKKENGEVTIRIGTFLKEIGDYNFNDEQIKIIATMLDDNNVKLSGKADKYNTSLAEYLLDNNVIAKADSGGGNANGIIKRMFETLAASKPLTDEEEKQYIKMLGSKNELTRKRGRDKLIISNLRLVASIARRHINKGVQLEDLILEGYLGLIKTIDKFDFNATTKFSTYATWWIRQAVTRTISDYGRSIRTPIHISEQLNNIRLAEEYLTNELGRAPTIKETYDYLGGEKKGFSEIKIIELKKITATPISLEKELKDDEDSHISDFVKDDKTNSPKYQMEIQERENKIERFLRSELNDEEYGIICMRFGIGNKREQLTLDEVSKALKYTKDKVRTIEGKAWRKLKNSKGIEAMKKFIPYSVEDNND
ncbi:MAG: RNA polymerase sigma factor [Mycoplasmoidaceae bacterium]|nr:MAG: RNA polymerase sigma factor [Mycoplasmoidaceae bacterium]